MSTPTTRPWPGKFYDKGGRDFNVRHPDFEGTALSLNGTDDWQATILSTLTEAAGGRTILPRGDDGWSYGADNRIWYKDSVYIEADPGVRISKNHTSHGLRISPDASVTGATAVVNADPMVVQVASANWTVDEWAGCWVSVTSSYLLITSIQKVRIVSNTSNVLTLEHRLSIEIVGGEAVEIYRPISFIELKELAIIADGIGSAGLLIEYVDHLHMVDVLSGGHNANGISIYQARDFYLERIEGRDAQFPIFLYNCDGGVLSAPMGYNAFSAHTLQLKDCRNTTILGAVMRGGPRNNEEQSTRGVDIKGSGLHAAYNCHAIGGTCIDIGGVAWELYSLRNEGGYYGLENSSIRGVAAVGGTSPGRMNDDSGTGELIGCYFDGLSAKGHTNPFALYASRVQLLNYSSDQCAIRALDIKGSNNVVRGGTLQNSSYGSGDNSAEVRINTGSNNNIIERVRFVHNDAESDSTLAVLEQSGCDYNRVLDCIIEDTVGTYTTDHSFSGANSGSRSRLPGMDTLGGATIANVKTVYDRRPTVVTGLTLTDASTDLLLSAISNGVPTYQNAIVPLTASGGNRTLRVRSWNLVPVGFEVSFDKAVGADGEIDLDLVSGDTGSPAYTDGTTSKTIGASSTAGFATLRKVSSSPLRIAFIPG